MPRCERARECDRAAKGRTRRGVRCTAFPIALKDNIDTAGVKTTAAAKVFEDRVPTEDAEVTARLKKPRAWYSWGN